MNIYALHTNTYHGFTLLDAVNSAIAAGFGNLEISTVKGWTEHLMPSMAKEEIERLIAMIHDHGLKVPVMSAHSDLRKDGRLSDFISSIHLAKSLGCNTIVTSSGEAHHDEENSNEDKLIDGILRALDSCSTSGMKLAIETHGRYGSGEKLLEIIDKIDSSLLGIAYDTSNVTRHGNVLPQEDIRKCAKHVIHVHLKDKCGAFNSREFTALGKGWIDFDSIFSELDKIGYTGVYSLEIEYFEATPPQKARIDRDVLESYQFLASIGRV